MGIDRDKTVSIPYTNHKSAVANPEVIDSFIIKHYQSGAIVGPYMVNPLPVSVHPSPLQVAVSSSGKKRPVIDMSYPKGSSVNDAIAEDWAKMPGFTGTFRFPTHELLCAKILSMQDPLMFITDLSAYYMQLGSDVNDLPYMCFAWRGALFLHRRLPFGCRASCLHAQRVTDAVTHIYTVESRNFIVGYVDDYASLVEALIAAAAEKALYVLFEKLGLGTTPEKSMSPAKWQIFLGLLYDLIKRTLELPQEKLDRAVEMLRQWVAMETCTKQQLESLVGFLNHIAVVVPAGRPFCAFMLDLIRQGEFPVTVSAEIKQDVAMWSSFLEAEFSRTVDMKSLVPSSPDTELFIAVRRNTFVICFQGVKSGHFVIEQFDKGDMYLVALWKFTCDNSESIQGNMYTISVPTKVVQNRVNRTTGASVRLRPLVRDCWLRQARLRSCVRAVCTKNANSWLYRDYVHFTRLAILV